MCKFYVFVINVKILKKQKQKEMKVIFCKVIFAPSKVICEIKRFKS